MSDTVKVVRYSDGGTVQVPREECFFCGDIIVSGRCARRCQSSKLDEERRAKQQVRHG